MIVPRWECSQNKEKVKSVKDYKVIAINKKLLNDARISKCCNYKCQGHFETAAYASCLKRRTRIKVKVTQGYFAQNSIQLIEIKRYVSIHFTNWA